jgi:hypothetical protein
LARVCDASDAAHGGIILDLLNFEWPDHLDITRREFVDAFGEFAEATVEFLARRSPRNISIIPVHQISFLASAAGDFALLPPYLRSMGGLVQRQLVKAAIRASRIVRAKLPAALLLSVEPVIDTAGDEAVPAQASAAERRHLAVFEPWDMLTGKICPELGGRPEYLNMICVRFFERHPWLHHSSRTHADHIRGERHPHVQRHKPFHQTLAEIHQRYGLPLMVTRAPVEHSKGSVWSQFVDREVAAALELKVPIVGVSFHPDDNGFRSLALALDHHHARSVPSQAATHIARIPPQSQF